jgi:hypothetical protein
VHSFLYVSAMNREPTRPPAPALPEVFEFELTDFDTARAAHDRLPDGVDRLPELTPGYWEQRRHKPLPSDRALTGATIDWVLALPPSLRPRQLCEQFPRVANAIATAWVDRAERDRVLDDLLIDRRGRRRGFPVSVVREVEALRRA